MDNSNKSIRDQRKRASRQPERKRLNLVEQENTTRKDFEDFLSDDLSLAKKKIEGLMRKFHNGMDIGKILDKEQYQQYQERCNKNDARSENASTSDRYKPLYENGSLVEIYEEGHHYFKERYKISSPDDKRSPYSSGVENRCVVHVAMMLLSDQGSTASLKDVRKRLKNEKNEYDDQKMPSLFEKVKGASYGQISGDLSIDALRQALQYDCAIGVGVRKKGDEPHMLVVDAIDDEYVYIRDSLPRNPDERRYCVTIADFENAHPYDAMVPSRYFEE